MPSNSDVEIIVSTLRPLEWSSFAQSLVSFYDKAGFLTKKQLIAGSKLVGGLNKEQTEKWVVNIPDGFYVDVDEKEYYPQIYKVFTTNSRRSIRSRGVHSPHPYWSTIIDNGFAHERIEMLLKDGLIRVLSMDDMVAYGRLFGLCCVCGRSLDDAKSIEAGIGPVCAKKLLSGSIPDTKDELE